VLAENTQREFLLKSYIQDYYFSSQEEKDGLLSAGYFYPDTAAAFDRVSNNGPFHGVGKRMAMIRDGRLAAAYGRLLSDVLSCDQPLPDNVTVGIKLYPAKSNLCMMQELISVAVDPAADPIVLTQQTIKGFVSY
jgi:hypothetical protein